MQLATILLLLGVVAGQQRTVTLPSQCSCGFRDPDTEQVFTESIIVYFNETTSVDQEIFELLNYRNNNQKGWNIIFPQGSSSANFDIGNNATWTWQDDLDVTTPSLQMILNPRTEFDHHSTGAEMRSMRRDILYGSFRAEMRSAASWVGGSAMSMYIKHNETEQVQMDLTNTNDAHSARVLQIINGERPNDGLAVSYASIEEGIPPQLQPRSPWDFMDLRFDWTEDSVDFWLNGNNSRQVKKDSRQLPKTPSTLYFSHWSTGDEQYMQGPPQDGSFASVKWIRAFFNSSLMTVAEHGTYDQQCLETIPCSTEDITLRGSTEHQTASTVPFEQRHPDRGLRKVAGYVAAVFGFFGIVAIINAFIRRGPWQKWKTTKLPDGKGAPALKVEQSWPDAFDMALAAQFLRPESQFTTAAASKIGTPAPGYEPQTVSSYFPPQELQGQSQAQTPLPAYEFRQRSRGDSLDTLSDPRPGARTNQDIGRRRSATLGTPQPTSYGPAQTNEVAENNFDAISARAQTFFARNRGRQSSKERNERIGRSNSRSYSPTKALEYPYLLPEHLDEKRRDFMGPDERMAQPLHSSLRSSSEESRREMIAKKVSIELPSIPQDISAGKAIREKTGVPDGMTGGAAIEPVHDQLLQPSKFAAATAPQQRNDYLVGLVAFCCVMVTLRHFALTFWPFVVEAQGQTQHFPADRVLSYIIGPWILTPLWIGPFFVTSCRFLAQRYLKTGNLEDIGRKMLLRVPRMLIGPFIFMILTYFLLSLDMTSRLEWLPSVSYSVWPYVTPQANFGVFLNNVVELAYLTPNAAPQVINHYCTNVLWLIPVQLQFSFLVLLASVMIKDIKKPWKRMGFYTIAITCGWYGSSWSACHWLGLMLADIDITYDWRRKIQSKWYLLYPTLIFATLLTLATPVVLLLNTGSFSFDFMSWENAIHPDVTTGRPIFQTTTEIWWATPDYYEPNLAVLLFSLGLQLIVELSLWAQKLLSIKLVTYFHPHVMTIYLLHGFVFWTIGSYIAVSLSNTNIPYWGNLLVTGVVCYAFILILTTLVTPLVEFATKGAAKHLWRWATEEPVPLRQTMAPFTKELIIGRQADEQERKKQEELIRRPSQLA